MIPCRLPFVLCCLLFWLVASSCAVKTATTGVTHEKLSMAEQDRKTGEALREASRLSDGTSRRQDLQRIEALYRNAIDAYPDSRFMPECYIGLLSLYLTDYIPPAFSKAEALRNRYLAKYPDAPLKRTIDEKLARAYAAHAEWEKLRRLYLPAIRRFVEAWNLVEPFALLMYSEAKFNLGDNEEARKGYNILAQFFPETTEGRTAQARIDTMTAKTGQAIADSQVQPLPEPMTVNRMDPAVAPLPVRETWKEIVRSNGDRSWVSVGPGTPPHGQTSQETPTGFVGTVGQPAGEHAVPPVIIPPDMQPLPENMEEKARMQDVSRPVPVRKNRKGAAPSALTRPAVARPEEPLPLAQSAEVADVKDHDRSPISVGQETSRQEPSVREEESARNVEKDIWYSVQVGFFGNEKNAVSLADALRRKGYEAYIQKQTRRGKEIFHRVLIGHFYEERSAVEHAGVLKQKEELNSIIVKLGK